eukprot:Rmarinus@m.250
MKKGYVPQDIVNTDTGEVLYTAQEIEEFAAYLDPDWIPEQNKAYDSGLLWLADCALVAPLIHDLPDGWAEGFDEASEQPYYYHAQLGTQWEHPSEEFFRAQVRKLKKQRAKAEKENVTLEKVMKRSRFSMEEEFRQFLDGKQEPKKKGRKPEKAEQKKPPTDDEKDVDGLDGESTGNSRAPHGQDPGHGGNRDNVEKGEEPETARHGSAEDTKNISLLDEKGMSDKSATDVPRPVAEEANDISAEKVRPNDTGLEGRVESLQKENETLLKQLSEKETINRGLSEAVDQLESAAKQSKEKITQLEDQLKVSEEKLSDVERTLKIAEEASLLHKATVEKLEASLKEREAAIANLGKASQDARRNSDIFSRRLSELSVELEDVRSEKEKAFEKADQAERKNVGLVTSMTKLEIDTSTSLAEKEAEIAKLAAEVAGLRSQLDKQQRMSKSLEEDTAKRLTGLQTLEAENAVLVTRVQALEAAAKEPSTNSGRRRSSSGETGEKVAGRGENGLSENLEGEKGNENEGEALAGEGGAGFGSPSVKDSVRKEDEASSAMKALAAANEKADKLEEEVLEMKSCREALVRDHEAAMAELRSKAETAQALVVEETVSLRERLQHVEQELANARALIESNANSATAESSGPSTESSAISPNTVEVDEWKERSATLSAERDQLKLQVSALTTDLDEVRRTRDDHALKMSELSHDVETITQKHKDSEQEIAELLRLVDEKTRLLDQKTTALVAAEATLASLLDSGPKEMNVLKAELDALKAHHTEEKMLLEAKLNEAETSLTTSSSEITSLKETVSSLQGALGLKAADEAARQTEYEAVQTEAEKLKAELREMTLAFEQHKQGVVASLPIMDLEERQKVFGSDLVAWQRCAQTETERANALEVQLKAEAERRVRAETGLRLREEQDTVLGKERALKEKDNQREKAELLRLQDEIESQRSWLASREKSMSEELAKAREGESKALEAAKRAETALQDAQD